MRHASLKNLLLRKIYNEASSLENEIVSAALENDWKLKEEMEVLRESVSKLNEEKYVPSKTSVQIILQHSRKTAPQEISC